MPSTHTSNLNLEKPADGEQEGEWGTTINSNMELIDAAVATKTGAETLTNKTLTSPVLNTGVSGTAIKDEDDMTSNSASHLATQQSIKAYVDTQPASSLAADNLTVGDSAVTLSTTSGNITIDAQGSDTDIILKGTDGSSDTVFLTVDGSDGGTASFSHDIKLANDGAILGFGSGNDVTVTHVHDSGLALKNTGISASPATFVLQTGDTAVTVGDVLGSIQFQAPDEDNSPDARLVSAEIAAVSEGTFTEANNTTKLSFRTATSEAASEKMSISSRGNVTMKQTETSDDTPMTLLLQTGETDIEASDVLGKIQFQAPDEGTGTDSRLVAAEIAAVSEGDFSATSNATKLSFKTGASEAASEKMSLSSAGNLTVSGTYNGGGLMTTGGNIVLPDAGNIGSASDTDAIAISSGGVVTMNQIPVFSAGINVSGGTIAGTLATAAQTNITSLGTLSSLAVTTTSTGSSIAVTQQGAGQGVYAQVNDGTSPGVYGFQNSSDTGSIATRGYAAAGIGVYGSTGNASYAGVAGFASVASNYGYLGIGTHGLYASSVYCVGALYAASANAAVKSFRIPHGLREGHDLVHSSIEGPQYDLIYRGKVELVNGQASIEIDSHYNMTPGTFEWLTKSDSVQTFTSNETGWDAVKSSFSGDTITIECQNSSSTDTISWMVIAERGDPSVIEGEGTDDDGNLIIEPLSELETEPPPVVLPPTEPS